MVLVSVTPEIALDNFPVYAGGLGVLEGDKFYAAARKGIEYVVLTFFYPKGYAEYTVTENGFFQQPQTISPQTFQEETEITLESNIWKEGVKVKPYVYRVGTASVIFFHVTAPPEASRAVERLYVYERQEDRSFAAILLAKAAAAYIRHRMGLEKVERIDFQESLGSLLTYLLPELHEKFCFVVHTIAPWVNFGVSGDLVGKELGVAVGGELSLYMLAMEKAKKVFAVSNKHGKLVKKFAEPFAAKIFHVTNGVNVERWMHPALAKIVLDGGGVSREKFVEARRMARRELENLLQRYKNGLQVGEDVFVVGWPRRITKYKRPYFVERLIGDVSEKVDAVFVLAGKPHPFDSDGHYYMKKFIQLHRERGNVVYMHDYDVEKAKTILAGVDLLLFTPFSGWEACGTSYMKAGVNGVPSLSSRDGGALEVIQDGFNGWLFGNDLEEVVNIYTDHHSVAEVDEVDYADMRRKFLEIYKLYSENRDGYVEVQLNALQSMRQKCDVQQVLQKYYGLNG